MELEKLHTEFGTGIPTNLLSFIKKSTSYAKSISVEPIEVFFNLFNINWFGGFELRYYNTPFEFFPFAGNGSGGEHFGYLIHTENQMEYKNGFFDPINSDEVEFLGNNTFQMLQNLLTDEPEELDKFPELIKLLNLSISTNPSRFYISGSIKPEIPENWKWKSTSDGVGILAPKELFNPDEITKEEYKIIFYNRINEFMNLAIKNKKQGFYGTALYFLKELYYNEWTNFNYGIKIIEEMEIIYELLGRSHLKTVANRIKERMKSEK